VHELWEHERVLVAAARIRFHFDIRGPFGISCLRLELGRELRLFIGDWIAAEY